MRAGERDALPHLRTSFGGLRQHEVGGRDCGNLDLEVDAVEHGARDARLIALGAGPALAADIARLARAAAAARVHRGDELNARRIGDAMVGPRDHRLSAFERLAQRIEHLRVELGQLVEEEHAEMGEGDFARARARAAADQRRHARRMMRRAERARPADAPAREIAGETPDHEPGVDLAVLDQRREPGAAIP